MTLPWSVDFLASAEKTLARLDEKARKKIIKKIDWFSTHFDNLSPLSLTGEFRGFFKLRIGNLRALYKIDWVNHRLIICVIGHRKQVYNL